MAYRKTPAEISRLQAARERLISCATSVVAEVGWSQASVTAVADSAGIAAGSVYQHFPSKAAPAEPAVGAERLDFRRRYRALWAEVVREGVATGQLPPQNAEITAAALTGAIGEVLVDPLGTPDENATEELLTDLTAAALRCAGAPTA
ncbi:TetR family transcriptional regulator [Streptomyces sp. NPDC058247]|uniref:TetR family transcriptional regulator n=1 Tax=Streptomyces sp. NPDC058247 TaxID=3346401 RepID=UPI0036E4D485